MSQIVRSSDDGPSPTGVRAVHDSTLYRVKRMTTGRHPLGIRHIAVIERASWGLINREIAFQVGLSPRTVEGLLDDARSILGAENRPHLVARAIERGVIKPRDWAALRLLTERQLDVAAAQARGLSRAQIAAELCVEDATVATHLSRARRATGCRTSTELAALIASERRCSSPPSPAGAMDELIDELARTVLVHDAANSNNVGLMPA